MAITYLSNGITYSLNAFLDIVFIAFTTVTGLLFAVVAYRLTIHPLASVPGPRLAAVSNIWHTYHARNGRMRELGLSLHQKYGRMVRVGPNEVWFDSKEAFQVIYSSTNGFHKSEFYLATSLSKPNLDWMMQLHYPDTLDLLSERDMKRYRLQRRPIGPAYHISNLIQYEAAIDKVLDQVIAKMKALNGTQVSLNEWMHIIAVECLGAVVLSWSPGMLKAESDWSSGLHAYQGWRRKSVFGLFPLMVRLEVWSKSLGRAFSTLWGTTFQTPANFRAFFPDVTKRVSRRVKAALRPNPPKDDRKDLMADLIQLHKEKPAFSEMYLRRMAITNFGAGHETMASTLTSIMAILGSNDVQTQLSKEILSTADILTYNDTLRLPVLQASIKESRRLYPVISMSLPRTVPSSGLNLHGQFFPPGTTVGCNPVALHRNMDIVGSDPGSFRVDRWSDPEAARTMERCSLAWGGGARTCPGRNLADLVVAKTVVKLVREFQVKADVPRESEMRTYYLSIMTDATARFSTRDET